MYDPASSAEENPVEKSNQPPLRPPLKNWTSSSSASSSSNLPSRQSSGSDIRNCNRNFSIPVTKDDRPPSRSRSARPSLGNENRDNSIVSSGFGSRRQSVSHGTLPTNSEAPIFPCEILGRPRRNSSNEISNEILHRLSAIENGLQQQNKDVQNHFAQLQTVLESMNHKFSECCDAMKTRLSSPLNFSDNTHSEVSSRQSNTESPNPIVSNTQSPSPSNSPLLDQKSSSRKTSELALYSRTMQTTKSTTNDEFEVQCICQSDLPVVPLIHNDLVHFVLWGQEIVSATSGRDNRHLFTGVLKSYNLFNGQKTDRDIRKGFSNCIKQFCPTMLMYSGEVTILGGDLDVDTRKFKLALYHTQIINKEDLYSWEYIIGSNWKVSAMLLDLRNTVCASYGNDGVAVVSIYSPNQMNIYLFSPMKTAGKYWKNLHIKLPDLDHGGRCKIQSCVVISNYIYCSLLVQERPLCYIYKINLTPQKQETLDSPFEIDKISKNIKCCFLSALNEKLISITSEYMDSGKTLLEVKQYDHSACITLAPTFQYYLSSQVRVVTASIVSGILNTVVIVYHDDKLQKCYVKKLTLAS